MRMLRAQAASDVQATRLALMALVSYEPETGIFRWKATAGWWAKEGEQVGTLRPDGYLQIVLRQKQYMLHRLAWLFMTGEWPSDLIDHRDRCRDNNRWTNLRDVTVTVNQQNRVKVSPKNLAGLLGVTLSNRKYPQAQILVDGSRVYLGSHDTPEQAHEAYMAAKRSLQPGYEP
jgi:HNH endonuclease